MSTMLWPRILHTIVIAWLASLAAAQFGFFDQMFGHQQHHQQQHQPAGGPAYYSAQADAFPCSNYLCPDTFMCVLKPSDCPCPDVQDIKCTIPDPLEKGAETVVCARGTRGCSEVQRLSKAMGK